MVLITHTILYKYYTIYIISNYTICTSPTSKTCIKCWMLDENVLSRFKYYIQHPTLKTMNSKRVQHPTSNKNVGCWILDSYAPAFRGGLLTPFLHTMWQINLDNFLILVFWLPDTNFTADLSKYGSIFLVFKTYFLVCKML